MAASSDSSEKDAHAIEKALYQFGGEPDTGDSDDWDIFYLFLYGNGVSKRTSDALYQDGMRPDSTNELLWSYLRKVGLKPSDFRSSQGSREDLTGYYTGKIIGDTTEEWIREHGSLPDTDDKVGWAAFGKELNKYHIAPAVVKSIIVGGYTGNLASLNLQLKNGGFASYSGKVKKSDAFFRGRH